MTGFTDRDAPTAPSCAVAVDVHRTPAAKSRHFASAAGIECPGPWVVKRGMDKVRKHLLPKRRLAARLRRSGLRVHLVPPAVGYDLLVNGHVRVALRVAFPRVRKHQVTVRERRYTYQYRSWTFNFHHHGRLDRRYADVFICVAMEPRDMAREEAFVIPWEAVSGKTFSLHGARRRYGGQYAQFLNRWGVVEAAVADAAERVPAVA